MNNIIGSKRYEDIILNYVLLALVSMNFLGRGSIVLLLFGIYNVLYIKNAKFTVEGTILLFMSFGMIIAMLIFPGVHLITGHSLINEVCKVLNFVLPFIVGYCGYAMSTDKEKYINRTLFAICLGYVAHIGLMYINNLRLGIEGRTLVSVWTGEEIAVTLIGLLSAYVIAYTVSSIIYNPKLLVKLFSVVGIIMVILINMQTATRTPFLLMIMLLALLLVMGFAANENKNYTHLLVFVFIAVLLFLLFEMNLFGVKTAVLESPIVDRFQDEGMESSRTEIAKEYFNIMFDHPWGGGFGLETTNHNAHNFWQQFYDFYGIIPFMLALVVTASMFIKMIQLFAIKYKKSFEYTLISIYLITFIQMLLEPVVTGYPILFWTLLLVHGMASAHYKENYAKTEIKR